MSNYLYSKGIHKSSILSYSFQFWHKNCIEAVMIKVLIVDKDKDFRDSINLSDKIFKIKQTDCIENWVELLNKEKFDVVLLSYKNVQYGDINIRTIVDKYPKIKIIIVGNKGEIDLKEAMELGAHWLVHYPESLKHLHNIILNLEYK